MSNNKNSFSTQLLSRLLFLSAIVIPISFEANAAVSIPGKIQLEDYDGAKDSSWYNEGGKYRWGRVDIGSVDDNSGDSDDGYYVGWTKQGEYLHYNIDITEAGSYLFQTRVASKYSGRQFHFKLNGLKLGNALTVPNTGDWQNWQTIEASYELPQGKHIIEIYFESGDININYVDIQQQQVPEEPEPVPAIALPGKIEAENYRSFYDTTRGNTGGAYRQDNVDIASTTDQGDGFYVGWIDRGETLRYDISVAESGSYMFTSRTATIRDGRSFHLKLNGQQLGNSISVPNSGGWQNWLDSRVVVDLPAGEHELEVYFENQEQNLNYIEVSKVLDDGGPVEPDAWKLVWQDEFNGTSIDRSKWNLSVNAWGGGNNELQYYTDREKNARVRNGVLEIMAHRENYTGSEGSRNYTSARLDTQNKADFLYGKMSIRAKLPQGQGLWPAIWMLPTDDAYGGWASSGEIDIMEAVNLGVNGNSTIHGTLHYGGKWPNNTHSGEGMVPNTNPATNYHEYSVEWEPGEIRWYVDGEHYQTQTDWWSEGGAYPAPFDQRFHLILNVAVGGNWPGNPDGSSRFPQTMAVDYVRIYEKSAPSTEPSTRLNVVNHGNGVIVSQNGDINCGSLCRRDYSVDTEIMLSAEPAEGYIFSHWADTSLCEYSGSGASDTCYVNINPDTNDVDVHAYFIPDNSCSRTSPFQGRAISLPGRIEAEAYDQGCAELAYSDSDSLNVGGKYRTDEVDIETTSDQGGGYNVGWLRDGEWLNYTVDVSAAGAYDIHLRIASKGDGSSVRFTIDGKEIARSVTIPHTGDWQNWRTVTLRKVNLDAGIQTLRLHIDDGDFNLNYLDISEAQKGPHTVNKARGEWTLLVVPDTQHYSQNRGNAPIAHMRTAFDWIIDTKDDLNIKFVQGLGDITESWDNRWEWNNSTSAWDKLYGQLPFMPIIGNHDSPWVMNEYFPVSSFSNQPWWGGDFGGIENNYALMTIGNEDYLFLQVETYDQYSEYRPAGMEWAKGILAAYPKRKVILATHDTWATSHIKNNLLSRYDNIVMSNAGHVCQREALYTQNGPRGGVSHNFIVDYQCDAQEVMLLRYYVFKPLENRVDYYTYSPVTDRFEVDDSSQGSFSLYQQDP